MSSVKLNKKEIGERISLAIKESKLLAKDVASRLGVSEVTISKYSNGVSTPKNAYLTQLAKILNVSVTWILTGEENVLPDDSVDWKMRALAAEKTLEQLKEILPIVIDATANMSEAAKRLSKISL